MNAIVKREETAVAVESALIMGDLSKLSPEHRLDYYKSVCESVGLNPLTKPFDYLTLNGRLVLYAKRDATDQLRKIHGVSIKISDRQTIEGVYVVTATATDKTGRQDESTGAVPIAGLKGDALANALMKCETKSKRRVTLSICGLGMLDETEIETIPGEARRDAAPPRLAAPAYDWVEEDGEVVQFDRPSAWMKHGEKAMRAAQDAPALWGDNEPTLARVREVVAGMKNGTKEAATRQVDGFLSFVMSILPPPREGDQTILGGG